MVLFYNKTSKKLIPQKIDTDNFVKDDNLEPVAVCVIPSSHNVYGDGKAAWMSLKSMNSDSPYNGSAPGKMGSSIQYGNHKVDISGLTNYDKVISNDGTALYETGYLPLNGVVSNYGDKLPNPYNEDGSRNEMYFSKKDEFNALADFDGVGNTQILLSTITGQTDWKTANAIKNNGGKGYAPAAACCARYSTIGTIAGDWYLPACGELGYLVPKRDEINSILSTLNTAYGNVAPLTPYLSWSSSEHSNASARTVNLGDGCVARYSKGDFNFYARAYLRF